MAKVICNALHILGATIPEYFQIHNGPVKLFIPHSMGILGLLQVH